MIRRHPILIRQHLFLMVQLRVGGEVVGKIGGGGGGVLGVEGGDFVGGEGFIFGLPILFLLLLLLDIGVC